MGPPLPGTAAFMFGWGDQQPTDESAIVTKLKGIALETAECGTIVKSDAKWHKSKQPVYICVQPLADVGGACQGDSGGERS